MKKLILTLTLLLTLTISYAQTKSRTTLLFEAKMEVRYDNKTWTETEYGTLYLNELDKLEQKYVGRLDGEVFKAQKEKLDKEYFIQELKDTPQKPVKIISQETKNSTAKAAEVAAKQFWEEFNKIY